MSIKYDRPDVDGEAEFYQSSGSYEGFTEYSEWLQSSSLKTPKNHLEAHPWCKFENKVIVPTRRLDALSLPTYFKVELRCIRVRV